MPRGLTLVELLVAVAVGLFIVATASSLFAGQLQAQRSLLLESRLLQELRTTTDLVTRDLRRAGHWGAAASGVWQPGGSGVLANPYAAMTLGDNAASAAVAFQFSRDATENHVVDADEHFGLRLRRGVVEMQLGSGGWQALTDATSLVVTEFSITPLLQTLNLAAYCPRGCSGSTCPRQQLRSLAVQIAARSLRDPQVTRALHSTVRLRNDTITGNCPV
jgi:type IV pilus assembly protein PilW